MRINLYLSNTVLATTLFFGQANAQPLNQPFDYIGPMTLSNSNLSNGSIVFRGAFENGDWQGDLFSYNVTNNAFIVQPPRFSALAKFAAAEANNPNYWQTRNIVFGADNNGTPFNWGDLTTEQQTILGSSGEDIVNFVRGDRSNEANGMRQRKSLLGAIIRSNPAYVGEASANINNGRTPHIYIGANDGMLHAFDASETDSAGTETWAYIPSMLLPSLSSLANKPYSPTFYVDGSLNAREAQFANSTWKTVLAGSLGAGGKGLFAIDVTDPGNQTNPGQKVLWELKSDSDDDMGYIFGETSIVKLADNKWYAANGNGFDSTNGNAVLYLVNVETGTIKEKIIATNNTAGIPSGLSSPAFVDVDGNGIADIAYAGDLQGDMWQFNFTNMGNIRVKKVYDGNPTQPISVRPDVASHPFGGLMVLFGTGGSYTTVDINNNTQAILGIRDLGRLVEPDDLLQRTLSEEIPYVDQNNITIETVRTIVNATPAVINEMGWMVNLPTGEQLLTSPRLRDGRLRATITQVDGNNLNLNQNWTMQVTFIHGSSDTRGTFDLNGNDRTNLQDRVDGNNDGDKSDLEDIPVARKRNNGLLSEIRIARVVNGVDALFFNAHFPSSNPPPQPEPPTGCVGECDGGLEGGHIDVDTDKELYGKTDVHVHEYDDKTNLTYVDYFDIKQGLDKVTADVTESKNFIILVANADLSPGAELIMGKNAQGEDITYNVAKYQKMLHQAMENWNGTDPLTDPDGNPLSHTVESLKENSGTLRIQFDSYVIAYGGIIPSDTGCVRNNDIYNGRQRNGALMMHLVDLGHFSGGGNALDKVYIQEPDDLVTKLFIQGEEVNLEGYGGLLAKADDEFLYESTIFWHYGKTCYGEDGYEEEVTNVRFRLLLEQNDVDPKLIKKITIADCDKLVKKGELTLEECLELVKEAETGSGGNGGPDNPDGEVPDGEVPDGEDSGGGNPNSIPLPPPPVDGPTLSTGRGSWIDVIPQ